jgi:hypothetical protein
MTPSEWVFHRIMQDRGESLIPICQNIRLFQMNGYSYTPDFRNTAGTIFYEVAGTRQALHANKHKYVEFGLYYPDLRLVIVKPDGTEILLNDIAC